MEKPIGVTISDDGRILAVDFVQWIFNEIEGGVFGRKSVADTYAILIQKGHRDFKEINEAIIKRWSVSGLQWIKSQAWKGINSPTPRSGYDLNRKPEESGV